MRAVRFDRYGEIDVLNVVEVERPTPGPGQVLVRVKAAGINPGESAVRRGVFEKRWPTKFPCGQGSDFAGVVEQVGDAVLHFEAGHEVIGFTNDRASHADYVVVDQTQLVPRPPNVSWEAAGALFVAGTTAYATVRAVRLAPEDTVVVSAAAGGVGSIVVQLAVRAGAKVIGLASEPHHAWLRDHDVVPVAYGEGVKARISEASGGPIDAFIDCFGSGYVELALELGVKPSRIDTIIDFAAVAKHGVKGEGSAEAANANVLVELAGLLAQGALEIPIARAYPLSEVRAAYTELEKRHTFGKIVLVP